MATKSKAGAVPAFQDSEMPSWQAESDMRTLADAHTIKNHPKRHAAAKAKAKEHLAKYAAVAAGEKK